MVNPQNWKTGEGYPGVNSAFDVWQFEFLLRGSNGLDGRPHFKLDDTTIEFFIGPAIIQIEDDGSLQGEPDATRSNVNRMVLEFQLDQNIDAQLDKARRWLMSNQTARFSTDKKRRRTEKYCTYLRAFDGDAIGATQDEIAAALYPKKVNSYPDYLVRKQISKDLKAARKLINNWFPARFNRK